MILIKTININPGHNFKKLQKWGAGNPIKEQFGKYMDRAACYGFVALGNTALKDKIWDAFAPLIETAQAISLPLAFLTIITALCLVMVGQKRQGLNLLKWAVICFLGIQWVPALMKILQEVGEAMAK
jgi:hypothetical protein